MKEATWPLFRIYITMSGRLALERESNSGPGEHVIDPTAFDILDYLEDEGPIYFRVNDSREEVFGRFGKNWGPSLDDLVRHRFVALDRR